jgi:ATP/maltotriose-dependent transcriptional regulator MalT
VVHAVERLPIDPADPRALAVLGFAAPVERGAYVLECLSRLRPDAVEDAEIRSTLGIVAGFLGAQDTSAAFLDDAIPELRAQGRLGVLAAAQTSRAWTAWNAGDWDVAASAAEEARRIGEETERPVIVTAVQLAGSLVMAARGDANAAGQAADEAERLFLPLGGVPMLALAALVRGVDALAQDRPDEAYTHLRPSFDTSKGATWTVANQGAYQFFVDAALATGHIAEARAVTEQVERRVREGHDPTLDASVQYARALLAEPDEASAALEAALDSDVRRYPFLYARLLLAYGTWLRRQRRVSESRVPLRAARDAFDALTAVPWAERARRELRASGETSRQRVSGPAECLTPQELEIASLAAEGMTNREIGRQLFLSPRTVASHLYRIFPKLGVKTRAQLGAVMDGAAPTPTSR